MCSNQLCSGDSASAWHGFFGWFGVVLLVIAALLALEAVLTAQLTLPIPIRLIGAGLAALGTFFVLLALFVIPNWPPSADLITDQSQYDQVIDGGVGFSWYIVLTLGLILTVLSILRFQQTGGALSGRGGAPARRRPAPGSARSARPARVGCDPPTYGGRRSKARRNRPRRSSTASHRVRRRGTNRPAAGSAARAPAGSAAGTAARTAAGPPPGYQEQPPGYQQPPPGYQQPPPGYNPPQQ